MSAWQRETITSGNGVADNLITNLLLMPTMMMMIMMMMMMMIFTNRHALGPAGSWLERPHTELHSTFNVS